MSIELIFDTIISDYLIEDNKEKTILEAIQLFESKEKQLSIEEKDQIIKYYYTLKFLKTISSEKFCKWYNFKSKINYNDMRYLQSYILQLNCLIDTFEF